MDERETFLNFAVVCVLFLSLYSVSTIGAVEYCWNGSDDDLESMKNMSCVTGEVFLANSVALKSAGDSVNTTDQTASESTQHYCMAVKTESSTVVNNVTVKTYSSVFSCDSDKLCEGKNMMEGYQMTYKGKEGLLYCCDTQNNCNQMSLMKHDEHQHSCFSTQMAGLETCERRDVPCVKVNVMRLFDLKIEQLSEEYGCDSRGRCAANNLTHTTRISCSKQSNSADDTETEICCCHGDNCFHPEWLPGGSAVNVQQEPYEPQSTWQRTMLIIIGVALGIIVVAGTLYFILRSRRAKSGDSPHHSHGMKYLSVSHSNSSHGNTEEDEDDVRILPRS